MLYCWGFFFFCVSCAPDLFFINVTDLTPLITNVKEIKKRFTPFHGLKFN